MTLEEKNEKDFNTAINILNTHGALHMGVISNTLDTVVTINHKVFEGDMEELEELKEIKNFIEFHNEARSAIVMAFAEELLPPMYRDNLTYF